MHLQRREASGTYKPAFFSLFVNAHNVLTEEGRIDGPYGIVFFHEYIHFLQDLFTNIGLRNIIHLIQEYSVINNEILNNPSPTFQVPYEPINKLLLLNREMGNWLMGSYEVAYENEDFAIIAIEIHPNLLNPSVPFDFVSVKIMYRSTLEKEEFYLGALHFLENMAHLLERSFSDEDNAPPFPYKVIEKIVKRYFPEGDRSAENMVTFMEDALQSYNPALYLLQMIEAFIPNDIPFNRTTIDNFANRYKLTIGMEKITTKRLFFKNATRARKGFRILFDHPNLTLAKQWSDHVLSKVINMKRNGFSFRELLTQNKDQARVLVRTSYLIQHLGTPIIMDRNNTVFYNPPRPEFTGGMDYLLGLEAVIGVLDGILPCALLEVCKHLPDGTDRTNAHCHHAPWNRAQQLPRCVVGQLWIMWGFSKKLAQVAT